MVHSVEIVQPLAVIIHQLSGEAQHVIGDDLVDKIDIRAKGKCRVVVSLQVCNADIEKVEIGIGGNVVECHQVIAHVHVTVVVDPFRFYYCSTGE